MRLYIALLWRVPSSSLEEQTASLSHARQQTPNAEGTTHKHGKLSYDKNERLKKPILERVSASFPSTLP
jgi:hypothetical protein